jgi:hypothetical protein
MVLIDTRYVKGKRLVWHLLKHFTTRRTRFVQTSGGSRTGPDDRVRICFHTYNRILADEAEGGLNIVVNGQDSLRLAKKVDSNTAICGGLLSIC